VVIGGSNTALPVTVAGPTDVDVSGDVVKLQLQANPNPSTHQFTLHLRGGLDKGVDLRVVDALGRVIEARRGVAANSTLQIGAAYRPGIYIVEAVQGSQRTTLKLIKQPD
jgi:hypothetical protein